MDIDCRSSEVSRGHSSIELIDVKDRTWRIGDEGDIHVHRGVAGATPEMLDLLGRNGSESSKYLMSVTNETGNRT